MNKKAGSERYVVVIELKPEFAAAVRGEKDDKPIWHLKQVLEKHGVEMVNLYAHLCMLQEVTPDNHPNAAWLKSVLTDKAAIFNFSRSFRLVRKDEAEMNLQQVKALYADLERPSVLRFRTDRQSWPVSMPA